MLDKLPKNALLRAYATLPLWAKIAAPVVGLLLIVWAFKMLKLLIGVGIIIALVAIVMQAVRKS